MTDAPLTGPRPDPQYVASWARAIIDELEKAIVGKRAVLHLLLTGVLADGHILLEDVPGLAKTLIARSLATVTGLRFSRIQFTPDLVPGDITGSSVLDLQTREPVFRPGPIFANLVLGDEINRAPPKTQAALLEAMEERQVTSDGTSRRLRAPFLVIATQNPIESAGTYPLPEAQLDRFLLKFGVGYPSLDQETDILLRRTERRRDAVDLQPVADGATLLQLQEAVETVYVDPAVASYMVRLVDATRQSNRVQSGASPRGSLALLKASRAWAAMTGRDYVTPDDVHAIAAPALAHRLILRPDEWLRGVSAESVVGECLSHVPLPQSVETAV
ncbi:MAG: MoxR family ATPase [Acidimicrobiia bacterium]|nr:MoxR family ATPase [Acidimicrobiia bacterium]